MNHLPQNPAYRVSTPPTQHWGNSNAQQQPQNNNQPPRALTAPLTANIFGGEAKFQPFPAVSFSPRTHASLAASITPIPGGPSAGVRKTVTFDPTITLRPTDAGGISLSFVPRLHLEASANVNVGIPDLFGTKIGIKGGGSLTQRVTLGGPEFSTSLDPNGAFNINANFNPSLTSSQFSSVSGGLEGKVFGVGIEGNQSLSHETTQGIKFGGPGVRYAMTSTGRPTISSNFDKTVSITNSYTFSPKTGINATVQAGPVNLNAGGAVTPTFTVQHTVTFSTDLARKIPPKHEVSAMPGVRLDGAFGFRVSLLPREFPVSLTAEVGFDPRVTVQGGSLGYKV